MSSIGLGIGIGLTSTTVGGAGYVFVNAEAKALDDRFTVKPDNERKEQIDTLISSLKTAGVWTKLDALYLIAAHDEQAAQRNWIADAYNLVPVNAPAFEIDRGYTGDGLTSYLNTELTPGSGLYALDSAHYSFWSRTDFQSDTKVPFGARTTSTTGQSLSFPRSTSGTGRFSFRMNQDLASGSVVNTTSIGHFLASRNSSTFKEAYRNGVSLGTGAEVSTTIPTVPFFVCALNTAGTAESYDTRQIASVSIGEQLSTAEALDMYNALNTYMTSVGAA